MAKWNKSKVLPENINSGNEFEPKDNLTIEELNAIVNNSFYGVDFVEGFTETPDVSDANVVGNPEVLLIPYEKDGKVFYKFKFLNLKGQNGDKGDNIELRTSGGFIQWKPTQSNTWINLISISDLSDLSNYVTLNTNQDIGGFKKFTQDVNIGSSLTLLQSPNGGIEIGRRDGTTSTPYIDFHTDGNPISSTDYNVRMMASGGTPGTNGDGTLDFKADAVTLNGSKLIPQNKFSMRNSSTVGKFYYNIGDGEKEVQLNLYPVGSIYLTVSTSPLGSSPASWIGGKWERLPEGYALWTASSDAGNTISAGLPNITGGFAGVPVGGGFDGSQSGAFLSSTSSGSSNTWGSSNAARATIDFNASNSNSIYGASSTVQPPAYKVYAWRRTE